MPGGGQAERAAVNTDVNTDKASLDIMISDGGDLYAQFMSDLRQCDKVEITGRNILISANWDAVPVIVRFFDPSSMKLTCYRETIATGGK